mmetsp:Transcript_45662/g.55404  ORF Transcript_45662/g.55404 Transcript_45662/m.55404 type:complete len:157 (+) Transcript_45662:156-626(+)|eukprot:CAMPEP_0172504672 /NCGR_PEP_ID=MMETSP1066-20121228/180456_1 /TAXON_ID=671091 /ORGANISM="Coscinodiscus wailesii, Strain CCMP2513" /LENGTH=156 /DNA_ID=CAMNT_0013280947 /DNA_START=156 /DNA_END=626 /DNA_ORIENTATION=-
MTLIRASRIPPLLSQITGNGIKYCLLITSDGELLGRSHSENETNEQDDIINVDSVGALVAEVAGDYRRAGNDVSLLTGAAAGRTPSPADLTRGGGVTLCCLVLEMDKGIVGVANAGSDCYVVVVAESDVKYGLLKARVTALAEYVREAFSKLAEPP